MAERHKQVTPQQIKLFRQHFTGVPDLYGTCDPLTGRVWQVKAPVTDKVIRNHLTGLTPFGVYLLAQGRTRAIVVDFDDLDPEPPKQFVRGAAWHGLPAYIERNKSKGYHVWLFADAKGDFATIGRRIARIILDEMALPHSEIFPKRDPIDGIPSYANFIIAPLFGRLTASGCSVFVDPRKSMRPFPDQWVFLESVQRISDTQLDAIRHALIWG